MISLFMDASGPTSALVSSFISSLGFPIFVAVWMLWKGHKDSEILKDAVNGLENSIIELNTLIKSWKGVNLHDMDRVK